MSPSARSRPIALGWLVPLVPLAWLGVFFLLPFAIVVRMAMSRPATAQPPYAPVFDLSAGLERLREDVGSLDAENFRMVLGDDIYVGSLLNSMGLATAATLILLVIGYPMAMAIARTPDRWRRVLVAMVILPFWTSFLIRVYAWIGILRPDGFLDVFLARIGLADAPLQLLNTHTAVLVGLVYSYMPFMLLPLIAALEKFDQSLIEAAQDLGCPPWRTFWSVTLPLTLPAAFAGSLLVFIPATGEFVIPDLLGGSGTLTIGRTMWSEFFSNRDWPLASALALMLLAVLLPPMLAYRASEAKRWDRAR